MKSKALGTVAASAILAMSLGACTAPQASPSTTVVHLDESNLPSASSSTEPESGGAPTFSPTDPTVSGDASASPSAGQPSASSSSSQASAKAEKLRKKLGIKDMTGEYPDLFEHGKKGAKYQRYIVLHDTEGEGDPESVVYSWGGAANGVAAHFVVGKDGTVVQCVKMNRIAHHAGFGDTGHNELYGVEDESRDDKVGTEPIGDWASDYGMNSYSIGIEMVHVGGEGDYPAEQLQAVDDLIAYIDAYYGKESEIIDHKAWRTGNSDTSPEFADYLANYQDHRTHD